MIPICHAPSARRRATLLAASSQHQADSTVGATIRRRYTPRPTNMTGVNALELSERDRPRGVLLRLYTHTHTACNKQVISFSRLHGQVHRRGSASSPSCRGESRQGTCTPRHALRLQPRGGEVGSSRPVVEP